MYKEDVSLSTWVGGTQQRDRSNKNKIRPGREDLLDTKLGFLWISDTLAARRPSATDDVRVLFIGSSFHALSRSFFHTRSFSA
jgi:hypothetical protein